MKKNVIAVAVMAVLGAAVLLVFRERPSEEKKEVAFAIAGVPVDKLDTIRIKRYEGKDNNAVLENTVLKKKDGVWRMVEPVDYPIAEGSETRMVEALGGLKVVDIISENKENHGSLEVDDSRGIEVTALNGEKELAHLIVGKSKNGMTFVRIPGKDQVYRIQGYHRSAFDKSVENLRDKSVTDLDLENVKKVVFANANGELVLERLGEGNEAKISPAGVEIKNFDEVQAKNVIRSATKISARAFVDEELAPDKSGLTDSAAKLMIESAAPGKEPETVTVWIGNDLEEQKQTYVKTSRSNQVFLVAKTVADRLKAKKEDFARTDEEVAKDEERKKKAAEAGQFGVQGPAVGGTPGGQQIPPDVMRKIQAQMAAQQQPE